MKFTAKMEWNEIKYMKWNRNKQQNKKNKRLRAVPTPNTACNDFILCKEYSNITSLVLDAQAGKVYNKKKQPAIAIHPAVVCICPLKKKKTQSQRSRNMVVEGELVAESGKLTAETSHYGPGIPKFTWNGRVHLKDKR